MIASANQINSQRRMSVLIVDDHDVVHWGFRLLLSAESWVQRCLAARNCEEALVMTRRYSPQVALIDLFVGEESGTEICAQVRKVSPSTQVLLTSGVGRVTVSAARKAGALGFVPKNWAARDLAHATHMVGLGMALFAPGEPLGPMRLSNREWDVLQLIARGATNREIADHLFLSPNTIKDHTRTLYRKMNARNRTDAVHRAQQLGLIT